MKKPSFNLQLCSMSDIQELCAEFHGYKSASKWATYSFAVYENGRLVAGFAWQPPPMGAASSVCPEAPQGVLALSRMVAVDRKDRQLRHISKPLRHQMLKLIDRTRWPVLITYHDEGQGHTGHVYKCSGWKRTTSSKRDCFSDSSGSRRSSFSNGGRTDNLVKTSTTTIQRWEHWICPEGKALEWMNIHGWKRVPMPGRVWRSGNPAFKFVQVGEPVSTAPPTPLALKPMNNSDIRRPWEV